MSPCRLRGAERAEINQSSVVTVSYRSVHRPAMTYCLIPNFRKSVSGDVFPRGGQCPRLPLPPSLRKKLV